MDRDQLRLKQKQQVTIQTELEDKLKTATEDRDKLNLTLKETADINTAEMAKQQDLHTAESDKLKL